MLRDVTAALRVRRKLERDLAAVPEQAAPRAEMLEALDALRANALAEETMKPTPEELLARIRALQEEVEENYREAREEWERKRIELAGEFRRHQGRYRVGLWRFVAGARPLVALTAPLIYLGWIPFVLMDLFVTVYQSVCFPVYGIPKVRRSEYLVFDRELLPYLNLIEKFNCFYCGYANGIAAYTREVAARTEQYWCPIKHARRIYAAHDYYPKFLDHGDAEAYRRELEKLRKDYDELRAQKAQGGDDGQRSPGSEQ